MMSPRDFQRSFKLQQRKVVIFLSFSSVLLVLYYTCWLNEVNESSQFQQPGISDINILLNKFIHKEPFVFTHFNDGEVKAMLSAHGSTDRNMQAMSATLQQHLLAAFKVDLPGVFTGIPCMNEFGGKPYKNAVDLLGGDLRRDHTRYTEATLFINRNYQGVKKILKEALKTKYEKIYVIVSEEANVDAFQSETGVSVTETFYVPFNNAFPQGYDQLKDKKFPQGSVVMLMAGPCGRALAIELYSTLR